MQRTLRRRIPGYLRARPRRLRQRRPRGRFRPGGIGLLGVSFAFGLTVLMMAYAVGHISGGHFNPAVTLGLVAGGRFNAADAAPYIAAQVVGAIVAAAVLYVIANGSPGFDQTPARFAANGYDDHSPGGYSLVAGLRRGGRCSPASSWSSSWA